MATQIVRNTKHTTKSYTKKTTRKIKRMHPTTDCCVHKVHSK